jgi:hypothetical protein
VRQLDAGDNFSKSYRFAAAHERSMIRAEIPRQALFPYTDSTSGVARVRVS